MLKPGLNIISRFLYRKHRKKIRTDSYWTDLYPSPEHSFLRKTVNNSCNWIYGKIDIFFQGSSRINTSEYHSILPDPNDICSVNILVWELNQGIVDIAFKDLKGSLGWFLPGFIRQFTYRLYQQFLLFFFTDTIVEEESTDQDYSEVTEPGHVLDKTKHIYTIHEIIEKVDYNLLSISDWWLKFIHKLRLFLRIEHQKKTYYLPGDYFTQGYEYSINNQNHMIRGPDKTNFNPVFFFHKRN